MQTAAAVIIGDEILTGKIRDTNTGHLVDFLRSVGISLKRIVTIDDDPAVIAEEVRFASERFTHVFTSGGLGPTHDDCTMEGIARAFDCALIQHPDLVTLLKKHLGDRVNDAALKMAEAPEGARLLDSDIFPTMAYRNIIILPGVPQIFVAKLSRLRSLFHGAPPTVYSIFLRADESQFASALTEVSKLVSSVKIGSYPRLGEREYHVLVTVEGFDIAEVRRATTSILSRIDPSFIVRTEPPLEPV